MEPKRIVICGGGFGGIKTAQELARKKLPNTKIVLISDKPHFEYHATLYRVLGGHSPLQVCVPLRELFEGMDIEIIEDRITGINLQDKKVISEQFEYAYDTVVLAFGSQVAYYNTEGLPELSFNISSIPAVIKLKNHIHEVFKQCTITGSADEKNCFARFVIVGGGVTGCEVAGQLAQYLPQVAKEHGVDPSFITIDLIHANQRLVPMLPEEVSEKIMHKLRSLGVNIFLNRTVMKEEIEDVYLKDMQMKTKTLVWTAGVKVNDIFKSISGLEFDQKSKVLVDEYLHAKGFNDVFVVGDAASTQYSGMAQTALHDGTFVAETIEAQIKGVEASPYLNKQPIFAIPVGEGWAAAKIGTMTFYGYIGWLWRKYSDLKFFMSVLPFRKAINAYRSDRHMWESCPVCTQHLSNENKAI